MVLGSLAMAEVMAVWVRAPSLDSEIQRSTENWSGVRPNEEIRVRKAWLRPNQAFRRRGGSLRSEVGVFGWEGTASMV